MMLTMYVAGARNEHGNRWEGRWVLEPLLARAQAERWAKREDVQEAWVDTYEADPPYVDDHGGVVPGEVRLMDTIHV